MSTRAFLGEEEYEDFTDDVPLKLHSVLEFLDDAKAASVDGTTEHQHVSSNNSENEEDAQTSATPSSLRLTPFISATAVQPRLCYCLDKEHCMCGLFELPPLLTRKPSLPSSIAPAAGEGRVLSSSLPDEGPIAAAAVQPRTTPAASVLDTVHFAPLHLPDLHLTKTQGAATAQTTASMRTRTCTTCCRC
ncbi:hypothetical protein N2W54_006795 [Lotmaria passim]